MGWVICGGNSGGGGRSSNMGGWWLSGGHETQRGMMKKFRKRCPIQLCRRCCFQVVVEKAS